MRLAFRVSHIGSNCGKSKLGYLFLFCLFNSDGFCSPSLQYGLLSRLFILIRYQMNPSQILDEQPKRLLPGSPNEPLWLPQQTQQQKAAVRQQADECRSKGYHFFRKYISGQFQTNYTTQLYHIGELTSHSFFFAYTFDKDRAPLLVEFAQFVYLKLKPTKFLITVDAKAGSKVLFVMVYFEQPRGIVLYDLKHPQQAKLLSQLTWNAQSLRSWMLGHGTEGRLDFSQGVLPQEIAIEVATHPKVKQENTAKVQSPLYHDL